MSKKNHTPPACPCTPNRAYADCCAPYIEAGTLAATAETLMRSRYSAFVLERSEYLLATWHESTRPQSLAFEPTQWLGLTVKSAQQTDDAHAEVTFSARYKLNGRAYKMHETSRFVRELGAWLYVDGDVS